MNMVKRRMTITLSNQVEGTSSNLKLQFLLCCSVVSAGRILSIVRAVIDHCRPHSQLAGSRSHYCSLTQNPPPAWRDWIAKEQSWLMWHLTPVAKLLLKIVLVITSQKDTAQYDILRKRDSMHISVRVYCWRLRKCSTGCRKYRSSLAGLHQETICEGVERRVCPCMHAGSTRNPFLNLMYESLVYLLNLWIVFTETDGFTIILNALALEFILKLDDEIKLIYMDVFPPDVRVLNAYRKENYDPGRELTERTRNFLFSVHISLSMCVLFQSILLIFFGLFYTPICKPGPGPVDAWCHVHKPGINPYSILCKQVHLT